MVGGITCRIEVNPDGTKQLYIMTLSVLKPYRRHGIGKLTSPLEALPRPFGFVFRFAQGVITPCSERTSGAYVLSLRIRAVLLCCLCVCSNATAWIYLRVGVRSWRHQGRESSRVGGKH